MPTTDISPLRRLRHDSGLSLSDFAAAVGCSVPSLCLCETGSSKISPRMQQALSSMGCDCDALLAEHADWLQARGGRLRGQVDLGAVQRRQAASK